MEVRCRMYLHAQEGVEGVGRAKVQGVGWRDGSTPVAL
jgi:hypothetical protein